MFIANKQVKKIGRYYRKTMIRNTPFFSLFKRAMYSNYLWVSYKIFTSYKNLLIKFFPKPVIKLQEIDKTKFYIDNKKTMFLKTFNPSNSSSIMNSSIHPCFYSKKEFHDLLLDTDNKIEKEWKTRILLENTPRGNIIMFYDVYKQGFSYYSDTTSIPYSILNSVAMKYVIIYKCRDLFVDNEITPADEPSPMIKIHIEEVKKVVEEKSKVKEGKMFVKFKHYSKNTSSVPEKDYSRNRFINMGKMNNFQFIKTTPKKKRIGFASKLTEMLSTEHTVQNIVLNYSDFKRSVISSM